MKLASVLITITLLSNLSVLRAETAPSGAPVGLKAAYPLTTCVVSDEALDSMGDAYVHIHKEAGKPDREIRLCCKSCLKKFTKDPAKYLGKLDASVKPAAPAADSHAGHAH